MAGFVNAADVAAAAVEIERRGYGFYRQAESRAGAGADKELFAFLAEEEQRHERLFAAMLERLGGVALPAGSTDEEYLEYVKSLLDSHCLFVPAQEENFLQAPLPSAIRLEKDTLLFFMEVERLVPDSEKSAVRECADEERRHLKKLLTRM
ncbi:MAG: ferritin family protein [Desulfovibrio sp.]|jgi:rubrerythrin|nr:ferritin family protein [Desulfovibrio sp.]